MADCASLERMCTGNGTEGSNPSLSAICLEMRTVAAAFSLGLLVADCEWLGRPVIGGAASRCSHCPLLSADMFFKQARF